MLWTGIQLIIQILCMINFSFEFKLRYRMKALWESALGFVLKFEQISGTSAYALKQAMIAQTNRYLSSLHEQFKLSLTAALDSERWIQCDVSPERQGMHAIFRNAFEFIVLKFLSS